MFKALRTAADNRRTEKFLAEAHKAALSGDERAYYDHVLDRMVRKTVTTTGEAVIASIAIGFAGAVIQKVAEIEN